MFAENAPIAKSGNGLKSAPVAILKRIAQLALLKS
jgi:hypothetical protein